MKNSLRWSSRRRRKGESQHRGSQKPEAGSADSDVAGAAGAMQPEDEAASRAASVVPYELAVVESSV
eukprot:6015186-Prymnesium_polylepis.1